LYPYQQKIICVYWKSESRGLLQAGERDIGVLGRVAEKQLKIEQAMGLDQTQKLSRQWHSRLPECGKFRERLLVILKGFQKQGLKEVKIKESYQKPNVNCQETLLSRYGGESQP